MPESKTDDTFLEYAGEEGAGGEKEVTAPPIPEVTPLTKRDVDEMFVKQNPGTDSMLLGGNVPVKVKMTREFKFLQMVNPQLEINLEPATEGAAGVDLYACIDKAVCLNRMGEREVIPTGIHIELPPYWEGQVRPRSGLAAKHGITVTNSPGTIDSDYRGEIKVILHNTSTSKYWVNPGDRIAQLVLKPVWMPIIEIVEELSDTERGEGGFGHTGS